MIMKYYHYQIILLFYCFTVWSNWLPLMWPDLRKGVFHTHSFYQLRRFVTSDWQKLLTWNLVSGKHQHRLMTGESFRFICLLITKLWSLKFNKLDVCGRPLFTNPVIFVDVLGWLNVSAILIMDSIFFVPLMFWLSTQNLNTFFFC